MAKLQRSLYEGAPGMLMDRIHEVNSLLANSELKTGQTESWKFWKKTSDIMKYAWDYMQNLNWVLKENYALKEENSYLRAALAQVETGSKAPGLGASSKAPSPSRSNAVAQSSRVAPTLALL